MKAKRLIYALLCLSFIASSVFLPGCSCNEGIQGHKVTLLQTTDMHNLVTPHGGIGGFAALASKIRELRSGSIFSDAPVLLVDSGDFTMGTVYDLLWNTDPAPFRFLQAMEYDVVTFGNHEYDYNPDRLGTMLNTAVSKGFDVPVVLSNTVFDTGNSGDDKLEALAAGTDPLIVTTYIKTLDNGVRVGFIGLVGKTADNYSPNKAPVTFKSDYSNASVIASIQATVDSLRQNCDVVIALSHSGINSLDSGTAGGDDITLAENISGINIIASGHDHETTDDVVEVTNKTTGEVTYIVCAGAYTTNLLQLDFVVVKDRKAVYELTVTNHTIDKSIEADSGIESMISGRGGLDSELNTILSGAGMPDVDDEVAAIAFNLPLPEGPDESGMGNLIADSFRWAGSDGSTVVFGACANGIIRNFYTKNIDILFADLFSTLPLGMTMETDQSTLYPGYTLHKVYVTGAEIWDICQFITTIKQFNLSGYNPYFCCLSGIKFTYNAAYAVTSVKYYGAADYRCTSGTVGDIADNATPYPIIVDSYVLAMLLSSDIQSLLGIFGLSIHPKLSDGTTQVTTGNMNQTRLDISTTAGIQEYQTWRGLYNYISSVLGGTITAPYNSTKALRIVAQ